ncbi:RHS repeat-associated core domain-containing protein [Thermopirellula anaerolimosa]
MTDHLNTVADIAKFDPQMGTTTVVNHLVYDAFGRVTAESNPAVDSLFLFTARPFDPDTGLQNNLNRWYDFRVGRWLSEDPIGFAAGDGNLYRYVGNAVILRADWLGLITPGTNHILLPGGSQYVYGGHWTWDDFLLHYMLGGGEVSLAQIGLHDTFWNSPDVQRSQQDFVRKIVSMLHGVMQGADCDVTSFPWWYHDTDVVDSTFGTAEQPPRLRRFEYLSLVFGSKGRMSGVYKVYMLSMSPGLSGRRRVSAHYQRSIPHRARSYSARSPSGEGRYSRRSPLPTHTEDS